MNTSRRHFLQITGAGALAWGAGLAGGCRTSSEIAEKRPRREGRWVLRQSTSSILFRELPIEQACERIAALGFEAVDLWSAYEDCPHLDDALTRLGPDGLRALLTRTGLRLGAFSTYVGGFPKYAGLLGGIGGGVAVQGSAGPCPPEELGARLREFFERLKPLAELAEAHRAWLAIENHGSALLDGLDSFRAFVDLNPYPRVGLALAPYHLQALGASVEEAIRISGRQLFFFYAWQHQPGLGQLPGHGPTDFGPWLSALAGIGYPRFVNSFMHGHLPVVDTEAALTKSRQYLRNLHEQSRSS